MGRQRQITVVIFDYYLKMQNEVIEDKVQYVSFEDLKNSNLQQITIESVIHGFESKDWKIQFITLTNLRQLNKYQAQRFLQHLMPKLYQSILAQVENLRSNNAKQALTLINEFVQHQNISTLPKNIIDGLVNAIFVKSVSEKGFLKSQALKTINLLPNKYNVYIIGALNQQIQSQNGVIGELAIKTLHTYLEANKVVDVDDAFLKALSRNINGKRAVIQKKSKEILEGLKVRKGQQELSNVISASELSEEESQSLKNELKKLGNVTNKPQQSFKDFIKAKKDQKQQA